MQNDKDSNACKKCGGELTSVGGEAPTQAPSSSPPPPNNEEHPQQFGFSLAADDSDSQDSIDISGIFNERLLQDPLLGRVVGNFTIEEKLGAGGFGAVYKASHAHRSESFAIKVLHSTQTQQAYFIERFKREARALSRLNHECIVQLADFGVLPGSGLYLAMEFIQGKNLGECIDQNEPFTLARIHNLLEQFCQVLAYIHQKGIVHRDIKPSNIMLVDGPDGKELLKIIDFGIASNLQEHESLTGTGTLLGTARFMSPEQAKGEKQIGASADLYAMAVILFLLLTRRLPVEAPSPTALLVRKTEAPPASLRDRCPEQNWTTELEAFMAAALSININERPDDALAFWSAYEEAIKPQRADATIIGGKTLPFFLAGSPSDEGRAASEISFDTTPTRIDRKQSATQPQTENEAFPQSSLETTPMPDSTPLRTPPFPVMAPIPQLAPTPPPPSRLSPTPAAVDEPGHPNALPPVIVASSLMEEPTPHKPPAQPAWWLGLIALLLVLGGGFAFLWPPTTQPSAGTLRTPALPPLVQQTKSPLRGPPRSVMTPQRNPPPLPIRPIQPIPRPQRAKRTKPKRRTFRRSARRRTPRRRTRYRTPCSRLSSSFRWTWATLQTPARSINTLKVRFLGCGGCTFKRIGRGACIGVPKGRSKVSLFVTSDGYQSCIHSLSSRTRKLRWRLKKPQEIMTMRYRCTRTYR